MIVIFDLHPSISSSFLSVVSRLLLELSRHQQGRVVAKQTARKPVRYSYRSRSFYRPMPPPMNASMSPMVMLPISDWSERLIGKRLVASSPTFTDRNGAVVFHKASTPTALNPHIRTSFLLQIPTELRLKILKYVLENIRPNDWLSCHYGATPASVMLTCKLMYTEARGLAMTACTCDYEALPEGHQMTGSGKPWSSVMASRYERCAERRRCQ